jgi:magnesium-transporting ATPase (P-type)
VETLGAVNVICSDKCVGPHIRLCVITDVYCRTGTLTEGKMTVSRCYLYQDDFSAQEARDRVVLGGGGAEAVKQIQLVSGLCNASKFESEGDDMAPANKKISGDATDAAVFRFGMCLLPIINRTLTIF